MKTLLRRFLPDLLSLLALPLLFFFPVTLGGKTLIPADNLYQYEPWASFRAEQGVPNIPHNALLSDLIFQNYQWKTFLRQSIDQGELPLWQPNQFGGTPFLANGQHSALYPFSLIYYILPLEMAYGWFTVSQLWLAGMGMYLFIRGLKLGRTAALLAAIAYQLSSFLIVATVHPMIQAGAAWLPLLLLMLEFILQRKPLVRGKGGTFFHTLPWVLIGAAALGMNILAGHVEITYYTLLIMAMYAALRLVVQLREFKAALQAAASVLLLVVLGFGIGAVQFIPLVEAANQSFRAQRSSLEEVRGYALPPRHVALWLMPNFYGNPAHHRYFDVFEWKQVQHTWTRVGFRGEAIPITNTDFGIKNYVEGGVYVGILTLILAGIGLLYGSAESRRYRFIFALMGIMAALLMFGTPAYAVLYYLFPGVDQLHTPFRWSWLFTFVLCVLAAYGVEAVRQQKPTFKRLGQGLILLGMALLAGLLVSRVFYGNFAPLVERIFDGLAGAERAFPNAKAFYSYQFRNVLILALMIFGSGIVVSLSQKAWRRPVWAILGAGLLVVDLFLATFDFNPRADPKWLDYTPPAVAWLQARQREAAERGELFRIQAYNWGEDPLVANSGWRYGLQDVRGYDSLFSKRYADYMGQIAPQHGLAFNRINPIAYDDPQALLSDRLDLLNVRYFITDWIIHEDGDFGIGSLAEAKLKLVYEDAGVRIYENLDALPRAYGIPLQGVTQDENGENRLDLEAAEIFPAAITTYESSTVFVDIEPAEKSWLILGDTYADGWRAFVRLKGADEDAEKQIPIERIEGNFRGVQLDRGAWTVRFRYSPQSFQIGVFASFISAMLVIFLLLVWLWNRFVGEVADADSARRVIKNSLAPIILNLFNRMIDFAFAFVMLRILAPEGAGIYYYAIVVFGWFDILTNFGLNTLLTREVARDRSGARRYFVNTTALRLALAAVGVPALAIFLLLRNRLVSPALDQTAVIAIGLLYLGLIPNSISTGLTALFYAFEKAEYPAALTTVSTISKVTLGLGALLLGWGVIGLAGASIITNLITFVLLGYWALPLLKGAAEGAWRAVIAPDLMRGMMSEAFPLMLNHLLATVFFKSDVILMEAINGVAVVGVYSTAYKWLDALNIIPAFFTLALLPLMSRQAQEDRQALTRNYVFGFKSLVMVALPVAVATTFMAHGLVGFLGGREFLPDGGIALQIMIWSIPIGWINSLTQYLLIALNRQRQITGAFIAAVGFNIVTNLVFLPRYSYQAAAVITIFSEFVLLIGFYYLLRSDLKGVNYLRSLWRPLAAACLMFGVVLMLWEVQPLVALVAGVIIYPTILLLLNPLTPEEAERLGRVLPVRRINA